MRSNFTLILLSFILLSLGSRAQYTPIAISGFNHDVIAESGNNSLATTTVQMDGLTVSNKVMYSAAFRATNGIGGGGIPDNGTFTGSFGTFQLAPYDNLNVLLLPRNTNGDINITTPAKYYGLRIAALSTEGPSQLNITLFFTDGSSTTALTTYVLGDWFNGNTNVVSQGFGRVTRLAAVTPADAGSYPDNPRMYYIDVPMTCADRLKDLQKINIANATTTGTNAPYPNTIVFALSGTLGVTVSSSVTDATCLAQGSADLTISGPQPPFTVTWNTTPVQNGLHADLPPGNYTATVSDGNSCIVTHDVTVGLTNDLSLVVHADTTICIGGSFNGNTQSNATGFSWTPTTGVSDPASPNPVITPGATTTYTVDVTTLNCNGSGSFTVTVPIVTVSAGNDVTITAGQSTTLQATGSGGTYSWSPATGLSATDVANPTANPLDTTTYTVVLTSPEGCTATDDVKVNVDPVPDCAVPMEAITPNGDGINDNWLIGNENCYLNAAVHIYNRYGSAVYENKNYKNDWKGTYKGKPCPDGTYYFVIEFILRDGRSKTVRGNVTILR